MRNVGKYFGTDGFRGEANKDLTFDHAVKIAVKGKDVERQVHLRALFMGKCHSLRQLLFVKIVCLRAQAVLLCPTINGVCAKAQRRLKGPHAACRSKQRGHMFHCFVPLNQLLSPRCLSYSSHSGRYIATAASCSFSVLEKNSSPESGSFEQK